MKGGRRDLDVNEMRTWNAGDGRDDDEARVTSYAWNFVSFFFDFHETWILYRYLQRGLLRSRYTRTTLLIRLV